MVETSAGSAVAATDSAAPTEPALLPDTVASAFAHTPASLLGDAAGAAVLLLLFHVEVAPAWLLPWGVPFVALWSLRAALALGFRRAQQAGDVDHARWDRWWNAGTLATGAMWGLAAWLFYGHGGVLQQVGLLLTVFSFCVAAIPLLGGRYRVLLAFCAAAFVPTIARIALDGTREALALAGIVTLIFGMTALMGRNFRDAFDRLMRMKLQLAQEKAAAEAARAQAESANRSKSRFFAAASHELRTPLTGVIGVIDLLRYEGEHSERVRSLLDVAAASGEALLASVNDLLEITRIGTGRFSITPADADLHALTLRARAAVRDAPAAGGDEPLPAHARMLQVLLADDNPTNQFVIASYLQGWGHEVHCVEDGREALAACGERRFDLVLLDGRMPGLAGPEVLQRLRQPSEADPPRFDRDVFVAAISANSGPDDRAEFEQHGAQAFVAKPVQAQVLHHVVQRAIEHQQRRGVALASNLRAATPLAREALEQLLAMPASPSSRAAERSARFRSRFMRELPAQARRLQQARDASDLAELAEVAHALKGASVYADLPALTQLAAQTELHARAARVPSAWASARSLQQAISEVNDNKEVVE